MSARGIGEKKPPLQGQIQTGNRHTPPPRAVRDGPELHGVFAWSAVCGMMLYVLRGHVQGGPFLLSRRARTAHACKTQLLSARGAGESATWLDHDAEEAAQARRSNGRRTRCWPYEILWATGTWWQNELFCKHFVNILQMHFVLFLQLFCIFYICFFLYFFPLCLLCVFWFALCVQFGEKESLRH